MLRSSQRSLQRLQHRCRSVLLLSVAWLARNIPGAMARLWACARCRAVSLADVAAASWFLCGIRANEVLYWRCFPDARSHRLWSLCNPSHGSNMLSLLVCFHKFTACCLLPFPAQRLHSSPSQLHGCSQHAIRLSLDKADLRVPLAACAHSAPAPQQPSSSPPPPTPANA